MQLMARTDTWPSNRLMEKTPVGWAWKNNEGKDELVSHGTLGFVETKTNETIFKRVLDHSLCEQHLLSHLMFDWIMSHLSADHEQSYTEVSSHPVSLNTIYNKLRYLNHQKTARTLMRLSFCV